MQIVLKNNLVIATHDDDQDISGKYPGCEIAFTTQSLVWPEDGSMPADPRTEEEKQKVYRDKRRLEYPPIQEQLDMLYWDQVNGTSNWLQTIQRVKDKYPKCSP